MQTMTQAQVLQHIIDLAQELDMLQQQFLPFGDTHQRFQVLTQICEEAEDLLEKNS